MVKYNNIQMEGKQKVFTNNLFHFRKATGNIKPLPE